MSMQKFNNHEFLVVDEGQGIPVVMVHAGIASHKMWDGQAAALVSDYRVIRYDYRGYGETKLTSGTFSHYKDLLALLDHLEIEKAIFVGCSFGGSIVFDAALAAPERVLGLVIVGGVAHGLEWENEPEPTPLEYEINAASDAGDLDKVNELEIHMWVDGFQQAVGRAEKQIRDQILEANHIALVNDTLVPDSENEFLEPNAGNRLDEISAPTLIVIGNLDDPYILMSAEVMQREIPNARSVVLKDTAHLPNMEKPDEFNQHLLDFISSIN